MTPDRELLALAELCQLQTLKAVLCTVVRLDGSGYGQPGARLLITETGQRVGYISGGCLEKDLCRLAWSASEQGPSVLVFDTRGNLLQPSRYNTGCEGVVHVLCQRLEDAEGHLAALRRVCEQRRPVRLALAYRAEPGGGPQPGALLVLDDEDGAVIDTGGARESLISGGEAVLKTALQRAQGRTGWHSVQGLADRKLEVFCEWVEPPPSLVIFGAGDDVQPVVALGRSLNWRITVAGRRQELARSERFPGAEVLCGEWRELVAGLVVDSTTLCLLMTHDFAADLEILPHLLRTSAAYIGILGPKHRLGRLTRSLYEQGTTLQAADLQRIHAPVGLDIGAVGPQEIALSITSEMVAVLRGRAGTSLHQRQTAIHQVGLAG